MQIICNIDVVTIINADATATPVICCFIKIQIGLTFLVPADPDHPGKEAVKQRCLFCLLLLLMSAFLL